MTDSIPRIFKSDATVPAPEAVHLTPIELETFVAEYVVRPPNLIIHLYKRGNGSYWTYEDAQVIWEAMIRSFNLAGRENQLTVEFVPELYSWCITIERIAVIMPPSHEKIEAAIHEIERGKIGANNVSNQAGSAARAASEEG